MPASATPQQRWWKEAVVYQVYPRSFYDSNGDGIGDLPGILAKLDYIRDLGVDVIWLGPHFDSPNADNGYDIRDYRKVMTAFGTMADFDALLAGITARGMKLIIDLVVNHSSDEHRWFADARTGPDAEYRDYYVWRPGKEGGPPSNYTSFFGGSAWSQATPGGDYYLHYFAAKQPDLNWDNPAVRAEVYDIMRFWLDKGVAGFRMDVITLISKDPAFADLTPAQRRAPEAVYANGPQVHAYLQEMRREVLVHYDTMTIGEALGISPAQSPLYVDASRSELDMLINFEALAVDRDGWRVKPWSLPQLKAIYAALDRATGSDGWTTSFIANHDQPRAVSHLGDDRPKYRVQSAKALATMMLTQRATPIIYQGDELGMTNYPFTDIEQFDDIAARNRWRDLVLTGKVPAADVLATMTRTSRDNGRTPMQWSADPQAGFTTGTPWLAVNPNYADINAADQLADEDSVYAHYQRVIAVRRANLALVYGAYADIDPQHERVYAYTRILGEQRTLVVINFGSDNLDYPLPDHIQIDSVLVDSERGSLPIPERTSLTLRPWQATIFRLR